MSGHCFHLATGLHTRQWIVHCSPAKSVGSSTTLCRAPKLTTQRKQEPRQCVLLQEGLSKVCMRERLPMTQVHRMSSRSSSAACSATCTTQPDASVQLARHNEDDYCCNPLCTTSFQQCMPTETWMQTTQQHTVVYQMKCQSQCAHACIRGALACTIIAAFAYAQSLQRLHMQHDGSIHCHSPCAPRAYFNHNTAVCF